MAVGRRDLRSRAPADACGGIPLGGERRGRPVRVARRDPSGRSGRQGRSARRAALPPLAPRGRARAPLPGPRPLRPDRLRLRDAKPRTTRRAISSGASCSFATRSPTTARAYVVSVILDGENAWEHYPEQRGAVFRRSVRPAWRRSPRIETVTASRGRGRGARARPSAGRRRVVDLPEPRDLGRASREEPRVGAADGGAGCDRSRRAERRAGRTRRGA